jgi:uncharacterized membrane protein YhaH (DUF805 family)
MNFAEAIKSGFQNYATFKGVASRSAYWYWYLFNVLVNLVCSTVDSVLGKLVGDDTLMPLQIISGLALLLPGLAVLARRFHDAGYSAKWLLLQLAPFIAFVAAIPGIVMLIVSGPAVDLRALTDGNEAALASLGPALAGVLLAIVPSLLLGLAYLVFQLIVTLKESKTFEQGNKYAPETPNTLAPLN